MAFLPLKFSKSWRNSQDFPTYEPDETQVRADMQLLHDETKDGFNKLVEALNDPSAAENLPFRPGQELKSATVQRAIEEVYAAAKQAVAGTILDHSIGKEKLTEALLQRIYGGRLWVSVEKPTAAHDPEADFPVGQLWLRPAFTMTNLAKENWSVTGGTKEQVDGGWKLVADGSTATMLATQTLTKVGSAGDRVAVCLDARKRSTHLLELNLMLNGMDQDLMNGDGAFEATLDQSGDLELTVAATWPYERPGETVQLLHLTVVNVTRLERALSQCHFPADWPEFVQKAVPFSALDIPMELYMQVQPGRWETASYDTLPVDRGGTGLNRYTSGQMLYADAEGRLRALDPPARDSFLAYGSTPVWKDTAQCLETLGGLKLTSGTYQGNDQYGRTITLPVTPKLLYLQPDKDPYITDNKTVVDNPIVLANGGKVIGQSTVRGSDNKPFTFTVSVTLQGNKLRFFWDGSAYNAPDTATHWGNRAGVTYTWYAIC